jgi:hypothetical protein
MSYRQRTVAIIDNGLFVEMAAVLAKDFGTVYYCCPWESAFPKTNSLLIGEGIPGVTRVDSIWPYVDEIDLFCFPDVYYGPLQVYLTSIGKRVWGARMGEELELYRDESKKYLKSVGVDIGPYKVIKGLDNLKEYLRYHENMWVKVSKTRGDTETFSAKNYDLVEPVLIELEHKLGAKRNLINFVVESDIPDAVEIGYDGYTIDGKFPKHGMFGIEVKDKGFIMKTGLYSDIPEPIRRVNSLLSEIFKNYQYRGFWSSEIRYTKQDKAYLLDPCARLGAPPNELFWTIVSNWADIVWEGAAGTVVEPKFTAKWGAELLIHSQWADTHWQPIAFPKKYKDNVRLRNMTIIDGKYYVVPQSCELPEIGAVAATGDTMEDAIKNVRAIAEQIEGHYVHTFPESLDEATSELEKLEGFGIKI